MTAELDRKEVDLLFEGAKEVGAKALEYLAMDFWAVSVENANIKTGTLRSSIQADQKSDNVWTVGTNLEYAPYVHEGYGPFDLDSPVNIDGNWVYIKTHPGYAGNPWFDQAIDITEGRLDEYLELAMEGIE